MATELHQNTSYTGNYDNTIQGHNSVRMVANGRFIISKSIGKGSFGDIFQGTDTTHDIEVAIKMEHKNCKVKVLEGEAKILKQLQGLEGIPKYYWYGQEGSQNVLVMELLGSSLSQLLKNNGSKFSLPTVLKLTDQILHRIESIHHAGILHRDIKPNNFVLGLPGSPHENTVYILDFGLSKPFYQQGQHFPMLPAGKSLTGTARYASVNSHQGFTLSRRDDLESIAYMLIQFLRGNLPWQGIGGANKLEKYSNILELKMQTIEELLCLDLPDQFCKFLKYVKELDYDQKPDYNRWRHEFRILFLDNNSPNKNLSLNKFVNNPSQTIIIEEEFMYDWQIKAYEVQQKILNSNQMQQQQQLLLAPPSSHSHLYQISSGKNLQNSSDAAIDESISKPKKRNHKKKALNIKITPLSPGENGIALQNNLQKQISTPPKQELLNDASAINQEINSSDASKNSPEYVMQDTDNINSFNTNQHHIQNNGVVKQGTEEEKQTTRHKLHDVSHTQQQVKLQQINEQYDDDNGPTNQQENTPGRMLKAKESNSRDKINQILSKVNNNQGTNPILGYSSQAQTKLCSNQAMQPNGLLGSPQVKNFIDTHQPNCLGENALLNNNVKNQGPTVQPGANHNESSRRQDKYRQRESSSSSEEELKIPILNNNYEGFKEVEDMNNKQEQLNIGLATLNIKFNHSPMASAANQYKPLALQGLVASKQVEIAAPNELQILQNQMQYNQGHAMSSGNQGLGTMPKGANMISQNDMNNKRLLQQSDQPAGKIKYQHILEELEIQNDPQYIQKQVGEGSSANRVPSFNINLPVFTLNPNQKVSGRQINLSAKQEQSRLNRLKQMYGGHGICPNFLFLREDHNPASLISMEPLLIQINEDGKLNNVEGVVRGISM